MVLWKRVAMIWVAFQYPIISSYLHRNGCLINAWWCFFITISFFLGISEYQQWIWYGPYISLDQFILLKPMVFWCFLGHSRHSPVFRKSPPWCTPDLAHLRIISEPGLVDLTSSTTFGQVFPLQDPSQGLQALMGLTCLDRKKNTFGFVWK